LDSSFVEIAVEPSLLEYASCVRSVWDDNGRRSCPPDIDASTLLLLRCASLILVGKPPTATQRRELYVVQESLTACDGCAACGVLRM